MTVDGRVVAQQALASPGISPLQIVKTLLLCTSYIAVSSALIRFNKYLMHEDRFPFSMALTAIHMLVSFSLCLVLYVLKPSAFPGMANTEGKRMLVLSWFVPIGMAFAISLYTSNQEGNVIITFLMSCAAGLQSINRVRAVVVLWIIAGASMAVSGEMHFVRVGFIFQLISQFAECSRAVLGEFVLSGGGLKLDPLSYTMFVAPTCLAVLIIGNALTWNPKIPAAFHTWQWYLLPNALLAFALNVLVAAIIKEVSAVGFILTGVCKDIFIVLFSCMFFGELVTLQQCAAFTVTLCGVFMWSYLKVAPESKVTRFAEKMLGMPEMPRAPPTEGTSVAGKEKV